LTCVLHAAVVLGTILLATVPFLDKAFHIDDYYYLQVARHMLQDPLRPYDFTWIAEGREVDVFSNDWAPPFFKYVLALGLLAFGESEVLLHFIMSVFTAVLGISTYSLALRFTSRPLMATTLVLLNPIFVPGQNLMVDTPMLALGMAGLACHIWGTDRGSRLLVMLGWLFAGLAVVTKYPAMIVFLLMLMYSKLNGKVLLGPAVGVAFVPMAVWWTQNMLVHGELHFLSPLSSDTTLNWLQWCQRLFSVITIVGSGFFPLLAVPRLHIPRAWHALALTASIPMAVAWQVVQKQTIGWQGFQHAIFLAGGLFLLISSLRVGLLTTNKADGVSQADRRFLVFWLHLGWIMALIAPFIAVRHVLWVLPPAALVVAKSLPHLNRWDGWPRAVVSTICVLGLSVGFADKELAKLSRDIAIKTAISYRTYQPHVFFMGEDGFAYYCAVSGIHALRNDTELPSGASFVVTSASTAWGLTPELRSRLNPLATLRYKGQFPMTTMSPGVNFYRTGTSDLPWEAGRPTEVYTTIYAAQGVTRKSKATEFDRRARDCNDHVCFHHRSGSNRPEAHCGFGWQSGAPRPVNPPRLKRYRDQRRGLDLGS